MTSASDTGISGVYLGTATRTITPPIGSDLSGFIARVEPMRGIHDDLLVKAMVWAESRKRQLAVLITFDLIEVEADLVAGIRTQVESMTGIPIDRIGVTCTHTHGGPATMPGRRLGKADPEYLATVARCAVEAVVEAADHLEPVLVNWGQGNEPTVGKNRRIPGGVIDSAVPVIRFQRSDGVVAALLVSYGCHPVTLGPINLLATADYPGYVRKTLESIYPGAHIQFATGCCGQVNNGHTSRDGDKGVGTVWRTYGEAERIGRAIAGEALQVAEQGARRTVAMPILELPVEYVQIRTAQRTIDLPFLPLPSPVELQNLVDGWRAELHEAERDTGTPPGELARLQVYLAWAEQVANEPTPVSAPAEIMVIGIGDIAIVLLPGESFVEFGLEIKERTVLEKVMTLAYANGRPGYIPHRSAYPAGGYEVEDAYRYYGYPSCFAPEAGELVVETALGLLSEIRSDLAAI